MRLLSSYLLSRLRAAAAVRVVPVGPLVADLPPQARRLPARPPAAVARRRSAATTSGASGGTIKTVIIKESEFKLSPSSVTLSKPGTYKFKAENKGSTQHSLEIEGRGLKSEEGSEGDEAELEQVLNPGQSGVLTVTFQRPGTYEMYCPVDGHEQEGMKGEVVVK